MQQNIDQLFKDGVEGMSGTPSGVLRDSDANWERIEGMLAPERQERRAAWIWITVAASVALMIGLGWALLVPKDEKVQELRFSELAKDKNAHTSDSLMTRGSIANAFKVSEDLEINDQVLTNSATKAGNQSPVLRTDKLRSSFANASSVEEPKLTRSADYASGLVTSGDQRIRTQVYNLNGSYSTSSMTGISAKDMIKGSEQGGKNALKASGNKSNAKVDQKSVTFNGFSANDKTAPSLATKGKSKAYKNLQQAGNGLYSDPTGSESYAETVENPYFATTQEPLSTFSIDVDRASYTNHRRFIDGNALPPKYSVRVEEFINYFPYEYPAPRNEVPFSILPEMTSCPWNPAHKLVRIALKGRDVSMDKVPASNIVFLLDVSGSMGDDDKLPLLKKALIMLTEQLREQDRVSIVVYAGAAGLVLPPTAGNNKPAINAALNRLESGGSTAGGEGIELAYATAKQNFMRDGNNRVILATDGDFNVGVSDDGGLEELIVRKRAEGVFLSVLGFGEGNLQDSKMELLADKGNGNYNYIDSEKEAKKVLVSEFGGTLYTIAKDVKVQVEFNPANVASYRLIGYENRKLKNEDFANDKIDAGELGAGHTVTAFYEVVPVGAKGSGSSLRYQQQTIPNPAFASEMLTVKLRYKEPDGTVSKLLEKTLKDDGRSLAQTSIDFRWAVAVAAYGMILRDSEYRGTVTLEQVRALARTAVGADKEGYRKEFLDLVDKAIHISQSAKLNVHDGGQR